MDRVNNLIKVIKADYCNRTSYDGSKTKTDVMLEMEEKFKNGVSIKNGQKIHWYIHFVRSSIFNLGWCCKKGYLRVKKVIS